MHTFKDAKGREWEVAANFATYSRVRAKCGVNLADIVEDDRKCLEQLKDPFTLGDVIWCMLEVQADRRGVTRDDFGEALDGDAWEAAAKSLMDEMVFFCRPGVRPMLKMTVEKAERAQREMERRMPEMLRAAEEKIDRMVDDLIHGSSGTNSPESSESTPGNGHFESSRSRPKGGSATSGTTPPRRSRSKRS